MSAEGKSKSHGWIKWVMILVLAIATKPDKPKMMRELGEKADAGTKLAGVFGSLTGLAPTKYNDLLVLATVSIGDKTVGIGAFGLVFAL
jgi:hypothetical protein